MRTDVKLGIGLGLVVVLVASLFLLQPWKSPADNPRPAPRVETRTQGLPQSTALLPSEEDQRLAATAAPPQDAALPPLTATETPAEPDPSTVVYEPLAEASEHMPGAAPAEPTAAAGFQSPDPSSVMEIHPAGEQVPYSPLAAAEDPVTLPPSYMAPSAGTELVAESPAVAPTPSAGSPVVLVGPPPAAGTALQVGPPPPPTPALLVGAPPAAVPATYTVKSGDSFWSIAERLFHDGTKYKALMAANPTARLLRPGQTLVVPKPAPASPAPLPAPTPMAAVPPVGSLPLPDTMEIPSPAPSPPPAANEYIVQAGDSLWTIAQKLYGDGTRSDAIFQANKDRLRTKNDLKIGQKLVLPLIVPTAAPGAAAPAGGGPVG